MALSNSNLKITRDTLLELIDIIKEDENIKRGTFADDKFDLERTLWDALHTISDLREYLHITGKLNKFSDGE